MQVESNNLEGALPAELGNMKSAVWMRFQNNNLQGRLPDSLKHTAPRLSWLQIGHNNFEGKVCIDAKSSL